MQATSAVLLVGARRGWRATVLARAFALRRDTLAQLAVSGTCLGAHFGLWVAGLQSTSLSHSLLLVSCTPLFLAFGASALGFAVSLGEPPARPGVAGVALRRVRQTPGHEPGTRDVAGRRLIARRGRRHRLHAHRRRAPADHASVPVRVPGDGDVGAFLSAPVVVGEPTPSEAPASRRLRVGAFASPPSRLLRRFAAVTYLALGPGLIGHTGYNAVLRHVTPLVKAQRSRSNPRWARRSAFFGRRGCAGRADARRRRGGVRGGDGVAASARRHEDAGRRGGS